MSSSDAPVQTPHGSEDQTRHHCTTDFVPLGFPRTRRRWNRKWWRQRLCCQPTSVSNGFKCMRSTQKANPEAGTGNISSRSFRLRITRITLLMNPHMLILSHLLLCIHARGSVM